MMGAMTSRGDCGQHFGAPGARASGRRWPMGQLAAPGASVRWLAHSACFASKACSNGRYRVQGAKRAPASPKMIASKWPHPLSDGQHPETGMADLRSGNGPAIAAQIRSIAPVLLWHPWRWKTSGVLSAVQHCDSRPRGPTLSTLEQNRRSALVPFSSAADGTPMAKAPPPRAAPWPACRG